MTSVMGRVRRLTPAGAAIAASLTVAAALVIGAAVALGQSAAAKIYVTPAGAALVSDGLALDSPPDTSSFADVPAPSLRNVPNDGYAQVTLAPWVESNGWRYVRGVRQAAYRTLPRNIAPLAAAEAFAFHVDALLNPDPADVPELGKILGFLRAHTQPAMPPLANIGVIDDGSPAMGEALNMLIRRNFLYRLVKAPEQGLDLTVRVGSDDFPVASLANPADFAARVREKLTDDRRLVRLFGANTILARLEGDGTRARLVLVSYARNRAHQDIRVAVLGTFQPTSAALYGAPADTTLTDVTQAGSFTEFTIPAFNTIAIVDLSR